MTLSSYGMYDENQGQTEIMEQTDVNKYSIMIVVNIHISDLVA